MKWWRYWPESFIALVAISLEGYSWAKSHQATSIPVKTTAWTSQKKLDTRDKIRELWYHGYDNYMEHAFPLDELAPLSCTGRGPDWENPHNIASNDVAGNMSLTLIDVVDSLVVLNDTVGFDKAVRNIIDWVSMDVNTRPQVFETTIRVMGGLLSGHLFATKPGPFFLPWYRDELLTLAHDLGERLLPAFSTATGMPYARVMESSHSIISINLRHGVLKGEGHETCTAGAGSLVLEFATLSRLTGDDRFEKAASKAFFALWNRRSSIGLVGNTISTATGAWTPPEVTGIGAGIDSFYEYALKWYILSGEVEFLDVWDDAYAAIMRYARAPDGFWFRNVNIHSGDATYYTVDSLSAFWAGLQVLGGDVRNAVKSHLMYWNLWRKHSGLPEVWDINFKQATSTQYPLRPELIESTWYLYRATGDAFYLDVGERILNDIIYRAKVQCGLSSIRDLKSNARDDRMESFALSETLKYLYLLFDEGNDLHSDDSNYVFTTEGHILFLDQQYLKPMSAARRKIRGPERHQCPAYEPFFSVYLDGKEGGLMQGVRSHSYVDYAREYISISPEPIDKELWSESGWCEKPHFEQFSYEYVLSVSGQSVPEDMHPSPEKLEQVSDGFIMHNLTGIRAQIVRRLDGKGYDIRKLGPFAVRSGQTVYINDTGLITSPVNPPKESELGRKADVPLRFFIQPIEQTFLAHVNLAEAISAAEIHLTSQAALFGADLSNRPQQGDNSLRFGRGDGLALAHESSNPFGCHAYEQSYADDDVVLLVERGECTFLDKLIHAKHAGAAGVIVLSNEELSINPSATIEELKAAGDLHDVAMVVLKHSLGNLLLELVESAEAEGLGQVMMALDSEGGAAIPKTDKLKEARENKDGGRVLYLNNHPLVNSRLLI